MCLDTKVTKVSGWDYHRKGGAGWLHTECVRSLDTIVLSTGSICLYLLLKKKRQGQPWGQHTLAPRDSESGIWMGPYRDTLDIIILTGFSGWRQTLEASPSFRLNPYFDSCIFQHRVQHGSTTDLLVSATEPHSHEPEMLRPHSESNLFSIAQSISPYVGSCIGEGKSGGGNDDEQKAAPVPPIIE